MADGAAKSISLPASMLEALGEYRQALKDTKNEIKELEREAKRAEKAGAPVDAAARDRRLMLGARAERLENIIKRQRADTKAAREAINQSVLGHRGFVGQVAGTAMMRANMLSQGLMDYSQRARRAGMGKAADVLLRASGVATKGTEALTQAIASRGFMAVAGAGAAVAAAAYVVKKGVDFNKEVNALRMQGMAGEQRVADIINQYSQEVAFGSDPRTMAAFANNIRDAERRGALIGSYASMSDRFFSWANNGYSRTSNDLSTKMAEAEAVRQRALNRYGETIAARLTMEDIMKRRRVAIDAERLDKYGTLSFIMTHLSRKLGISDEQDIVTRADMGRWIPLIGPFIRYGWGGAEAAEYEDTAANWTITEEKKIQEDRQSALKAWAEGTHKALERAKSHLRMSAIQAFEQDKLTRAVTWRMQ